MALCCISRSNQSDLSSHQTEFLQTLSESDIKGKIRQRGCLGYSLHILPWNLRCRPKPLAVVYPVNPEEVSTVVKIAAKYGIPVQPRSGGHSYGSYSLGGKDGAMVVDLSKMNSVVVDQTTWRATIGGGTRLGDVTRSLYSQGKRAIAHGTCPQVGIGGHATVGGQGPLSRLYGLTLDHVVNIEVVLGDGSIVNANDNTNPDLFFAMRGAGASMGIATCFTVKTHPAPEVVAHYSFQLKCASSDELATRFMKWQDFIASPPVSNDRLFNSIISITRNTIIIEGCRLGTCEELESSEAFVSLRDQFEIDITTRELDWMGSVSHWATSASEGVAGALSMPRHMKGFFNWTTNALESLVGALPIPLYMKSLTVRRNKLLTPEAIRAWFDYMHEHSPSNCAWIILADLEGGCISDAAPDSTAYSLRDGLYGMCAYTIGWMPFPDTAISFLNGMIDTITTEMPNGNFGVYPGYVDPELPKTKWPGLYWGANYPRLLEVKRRYDARNVFCNPQSVGSGSDYGLVKPSPRTKSTVTHASAVYKTHRRMNVVVSVNWPKNMELVSGLREVIPLQTFHPPETLTKELEQLPQLRFRPLSIISASTPIQIY